MPPILPTRKLGKNGPQAPTLGLGLMGLLFAYGKVESDEARFKVLDRAFELGETFWDSSDLYGDSERLVGKLFAKNPDKRKDIFLATKFAFVHMGDKPGPMIDSSPEYVKEAWRERLIILGSARFLQRHFVEPTRSPTLMLYRSNTPFSTDIDSPEVGLLKTCRELGVAIVAYSPLGRRRGLLPYLHSSLLSENFKRNLKLVDGMKTLAKTKNATTGQLTLAWLLAQGDDIFAIPSTKKIEYLEENLGAVKLELSKEEEAQIRKLVDAAEVHGGRYPDIMKYQCFADTPALNA
ncbi:hypothetical protein EAE99_009560 [Botrytis elliptica]|nr:hypothetical protein EAE99_009560 [Botrytis elliptica]